MISPLDLAELELQQRPFNLKGWVFELKYDGFRILALHSSEGVKPLSRRGTPYHHLFRSLSAK